MKMYYSLISKYMLGDLWSVQFGDYDKEVVKSELDYYKEGGEYHQLKIIRTGDKQELIDREVKRLNDWHIKG